MGQVSDLCQSCPIFSRLGGCSAVGPRLPTKECHFLFVGEAPGWQECRNGEPFIGESGQLLRTQIEAAKVSLDNCLFSNSTWCAPRERTDARIGTPTPEEAYHCVAHTYYLITQQKPKMVVAVGGVALRALTGETSPTKARGRLLDICQPPAAAVNFDYLTWAIHNQPTLEADERHSGLWFAPFQVGTDDLAIRHRALLAEEVHGYTPTWDDIPVLATVHPAYALRNGGLEGRWGESILFDLRYGQSLLEGDSFKETRDYKWINDLEGWKAWVDEAVAAYKRGEYEVMACDLETSEEIGEHERIGLIPFQIENRILSIQFSYTPNTAISVMVNHRESAFNDPASFRIFRHYLEKLVTAVPQVGHNFAFDFLVMRTRLGFRRVNVHADTMLMEHWLNMGKRTQYGLDALGARYVGTARHKAEAQQWRDKNPGKTYEDMPLDVALYYSAGDADVTLQLYCAQRGLLEKEYTEALQMSRWSAYREFYYGENEAWQLVVDMMWCGMPVDMDCLKHLSEIYPERIDGILVELHENPFVKAWMERKRQAYNEETVRYNASIVGTRRKPWPIFDPVQWRDDRDRWFNPNSWQQILDLWINDMKLPYTHMDDLELKEGCVGCFCSDKQCRCDPKPGKATVPTTDKDNRKVILNYLNRWKDATENRYTALLESPDNRDAELRTLEGNLAVWEQWIGVMELLGRFKKLSKHFGTYVTGIFPLIVDKVVDCSQTSGNVRCFPLYREYADFPEGNRLHPGYKQHGTVTGRLASVDPNGQNFPGAEDEAGYVRWPYISRWNGRGGILVSPDFSQIEVRVMVCLARDFGIAEAINCGKDIHVYVAAIVYDLPEDEITDKERKPTKNVTFGILYGKTVAGLAQTLQIPLKAAQELVDKFFGQMPKVRDFVHARHEEVISKGYVETLMGRRRYIDDIRSNKRGHYNKALREAVNTPIQSIASDVCWAAMGRTWKRIQEFKIEAYPYCIIHDSQTFDVCPGRFMDVMEIMYYEMVLRSMQIYPWLICKPEAEFELGAGWGYPVDCAVKFGADNALNNELTFSGKQENIDRLEREIIAGGQGVVRQYDGLHPKKAEADKGTWQRVVTISRSNSIVRIEGTELALLAS